MLILSYRSVLFYGMGSWALQREIDQTTSFFLSFGQKIQPKQKIY